MINISLHLDEAELIYSLLDYTSSEVCTDELIIQFEMAIRDEKSKISNEALQNT